MSRRPAWAALARLQLRSPGVLIVAGAAVTALALPLVLQLGVDPAWTALLPQDRPSVRDLERVSARVGGLSTLTVVLESSDGVALRRFADELGPRLRALPAEWVRSVDWRSGVMDRFVREHRHLYAGLDDLVEVRDVLQERLDYERRARNPLLLNLDEGPAPDPAELLDRLDDELEGRFDSTGDDYLVHPDGDLLVMLISTPLSGTDLDGVDRFTAAVEAQATDLDTAAFADDLQVHLTGGLLGARAEQYALVRELTIATVVTVMLVMLAIYGFFRRARAILLLGLALIAPLTVTFALARLTVGGLNTSTAFLGSIVIGNGINPGIIWLARYFEVRRQGLDGAAALEAAHRGTWLATVVASLAAAAAYASLVGTEFRGFRDFGIISGIGMVACWAGAYLLLPAMAVVSERWSPLRFAHRRTPAAAPGAIVARAVTRHPGWILAVAIALVAVSAVIVVAGAMNNPIEYDFRRLRSERRAEPEIERRTRRVDEAVGRSRGGDAIAVLVPAVDEVEPILDQLEALSALEEPPIGDVRSLQGMLPTDQGLKVATLARIRELAEELRRYADPQELETIDREMPPADLAPLELGDLPPEAVRAFAERDGSLGRLLLVGPAEGRSVWDGRYLVEWAAALRTLRLTDGTRPPLAGRGPVFADLIEAVWSDGPRAVFMALAATTLLVFLAFPHMWQRMLTLASLLIGIMWMAATMLAFGMKLNFLNFVAFPITFGNGVDYGVNIMRRLSQESVGRGSAPGEAAEIALRQTGTAVALCSLTTIIGYVSLQASSNLAIRSFGQAMAISEVTCLAAACFGLVAMFVLRSRR